MTRDETRFGAQEKKATRKKTEDATHVALSRCKIASAALKYTLNEQKKMQHTLGRRDVKKGVNAFEIYVQASSC